MWPESTAASAEKTTFHKNINKNKTIKTIKITNKNKIILSNNALGQSFSQ